MFQISTFVLVEMCKKQDIPRAVYVEVTENALPADVQVVGIEAGGWCGGGNDRIVLVLESAEWYGDERSPLPTPTMLMHFELVPQGDRVDVDV
jgi:hypothetical protein